MLRQPFLSQRPCILHLRRLASTFSQSTSPINPAGALSSVLGAADKNAGVSGTSQQAKTVRVIDPETKEEITVNLDTVEPFTHEFGLLPLRFRTQVERRHLFKTLRERQNTAYEVEVKEGDAQEPIEPDSELVEKYITEFIQNRKQHTDEPPSEEKIYHYIESAKRKAIKEQKKRLMTATATKSNDQTLSFQDQWHRRQDYAQNILKPMTSDFIARYNPHRDLRAPVRPRNVTIEHLLAAGCHLGHNKSSCHPAMKPFITGLHDNTHIINLDCTLAHLRRACTIIREVAFRHGVILLIGTRKGHKPILVSATERMGGTMLFRKWIPGTITNGNNVLHRGHLKDEVTPFKQYAKSEVKEELAKKPLWEGPTLQTLLYDRKTGTWVPSDETVPEYKDSNSEARELQTTASQSKSPESSTLGTSTVQTRSTPSDASRSKMSISLDHKPQGDRAEWMAWDKFASIVQSVADFSTDILLGPQQALPQGYTESIPDHGDNWYQRQLEVENARIEHRRALSDETGDRNPLEMHEMDKFLRRKRFEGMLRGRYLADRFKSLGRYGLGAYPKVKVFRDGSTMIGDRRFDRTGAPLTRYSDGSYLLNHQVYDREGKRYAPSQNAFIFSDGSQLRFLHVDGERKLVVKIRKQMFDVTSTVVGSAEKREILEKVNDLFDQSRAVYTPDEPLKTDPLERVSTQELVQYGFKEEPKKLQATVTEDLLRESEPIAMRGSEMLEISDNVDSKALEDLVSRSNRMTESQENLHNVEYVDPAPETPFDNMYSTSPSTIRPELIVVLNPRENRLALREATNNQIPTIGLIDTDSDPRWVTYSIPANDDSLRSVEYLMGVLSRAGEEGLIHRRRYAEQIEMLTDRAKETLKETQADYEALTRSTRDPRTPSPYVGDDRTPASVLDKYYRWYKLDRKTTELDAVIKIVANQIILAQNEIKRLNPDTTGWAMQDFLDHVKTSTQFPGIPDVVLEKMAYKRIKETRQAYAMSKEKVERRRLLKMAMANPEVQEEPEET